MNKRMRKKHGRYKPYYWIDKFINKSFDRDVMGGAVSSLMGKLYLYGGVNHVRKMEEVLEYFLDHNLEYRHYTYETQESYERQVLATLLGVCEWDEDKLTQFVKENF